MPAAFQVHFPLGFEEPEGFAIRFVPTRGDRLDFGRGLYFLDGPNGAGKSTFLNLLALLAGQVGTGDGGCRGRIVYAGNDYRDSGFTTLRAADLREAYFAIFPQRAFFLPVSTRDNYRILNGRDPLRALDFSDREIPQHLSGGQQQCVLMQIVLDPHKPVWFLDEPLANLDAERRLAFWRLVAAGWGERVHIIFYIDHLMAARVHADRSFVCCECLQVTYTHRCTPSASDEIKTIRLYHTAEPDEFFQRQIEALEKDGVSDRDERSFDGAAREKIL